MLKNKRLLIVGIFVVIIIVLLVFLLIYQKASVTNDSTFFVYKEALKLYELKKAEGMQFNSQCLGTIIVGNVSYAVDVVNVPRTDEDNKAENQCEDYKSGKVKHFVELDKDGEVARIV